MEAVVGILMLFVATAVVMLMMVIDGAFLRVALVVLSTVNVIVMYGAAKWWLSRLSRSGALHGGLRINATGASVSIGYLDLSKAEEDMLIVGRVVSVISITAAVGVWVLVTRAWQPELGLVGSWVVIPVNAFISQSSPFFIRREVAAAIHRMEEDLQPVARQLALLSEIDGAIAHAAEAHGVQIATHYCTTAAENVAASVACGSLGATGLVQAAEKTVAEATQHRDAFATALSTHQRLMEQCDSVAKSVSATGSVSLLRQLDSIYEGLNSQQLHGMFVSGDWEELQDVFQLMVDDLARIQGIGAGCRTGGDTAPDRNSLSEEEQAYVTLGVPPGASDEDIRAAYRLLSRMWHPDKGVVKDDSRMKDINEAYDRLRGPREAT